MLLGHSPEDESDSCHHIIMWCVSCDDVTRIDLPEKKRKHCFFTKNLLKLTKMKTFHSFICILVCCVASTIATRWKDCGSTQGTVKSVAVQGCKDQQTCELHRGTNVTFTVDFTPKETITKATAVVHGILAGVPIPFPIDCPAACKGCGLTCPVPKDKDTIYKLTLPVKTAYPSVKVIVKFELKDPSNADLFCVEVPAAVVP